MTRRRNRDPGALRQLHPTKRFEDYVANATQAKLSGFINSQIDLFGKAMADRTAENFQNFLTRLIALESLLVETVPAITKEALENSINKTQDRLDDMEEAPEGSVVEVGDRVRLGVQTKGNKQEEFSGINRMAIDEVGEGHTRLPDLENALLGMKVGETKDIVLGSARTEPNMRLSIDKISRKIKVEEPASQASQPEESPNVSPNAG